MGQNAGRPRVLRVSSAAELAPGLEREGLSAGRPVIVLVGGAGGMDEREIEALATVLVDAVLPALGDDGVVVDGGTDSGVMHAAGRAREAAGFAFPLVGVAAAGTVGVGETASPTTIPVGLEHRHSLVVLVPGEEWGDESAWIDLVATSIAAGRPSVTVLANGGAISGEDVERSLTRGRPVVVLAGSGRLADDIARPSAGEQSDDGSAAGVVTRIARSDLTTIADMHDLEAVRSAVSAVVNRVQEDS